LITPLPAGKGRFTISIFFDRGSIVKNSKIFPLTIDFLIFSKIIFVLRSYPYPTVAPAKTPTSLTFMVNGYHMDIQHTHTARGGRFYTGDSDAPASQLSYRMAGTHKMIIDHTEVNEHKGEGVGTHLVAAAAEYARQHDIKILPVCHFAKVILENNKDLADVLVPAH
jgi:uncharacterized protein